jgi:isopenicillin-N N-acyltransferase-like protein
VSSIRVVRTEGDAVERGRQIGRQLGDLIEASLGFYHRCFEQRGVGSSEFQDRLAPSLAATEAHLPAYLATIKAMAEGAMVPVWELFAVNAFEELEPSMVAPEHGSPFLQEKGGGFPPVGSPRVSERCSTITVATEGATFLGHNEHWLAGGQGNVAVVVEMPTDGTRAVASPTVVCCIPAVGINEFRGGQGIASLRSVDDGIGVPRVLVSRSSLDASDRMDAVHRARLPARAGGYAHSFAFPGGDTFMVETTAIADSLLEGPGPHTNHYLDPELAERAPPPPPGSLYRYERLLDLLEEERPASAFGVMDILRDHGEGSSSICLHPDPADGDEASTVIFSMVCELEAGRMWVAAGNPCTVSYEEINLAGVIEGNP